MTNLRKTQEKCLVCVASPNLLTPRIATEIRTEWGFISGWSRDGHGMVTPELNNFKPFDDSGMNGMTFYSLRDRKMRIRPLIRGEKRSRQAVSCENLVFSSRGSKYPNLQETSGDEKMNPDSVRPGPSISTSYVGPDIRNSKGPKDELHAGGATTLLPDPSEGSSDPAKALYGLRIDFDSGTVTRLYIMLELMPKKPRKKFRKKPVDRSGGG